MRALDRLTQPVCAGIDVGNGRVKVATNVGDSFSFQSTAAPAARFGEAVAGTENYKPVIVDGDPWLVGFKPKLVQGYKRAIHQGAHFSKEHYALFCEALARIGRNVDVAIVGMTVDQIGQAPALKDKFQGEHRAHGLSFNVDRLGVYPQPRGTAEDYLDSLDEVEDQTVLIIDLGEGSTDVNLWTAVNDDDHLTVTIDRGSAFSEWIGVAKVSEAIGKELSVNPADVSRAFIEKEDAIKGRPLAPMIDQYAKPLAETLATGIRSKVRAFDEVDVVLLTGGGAHIFGKYLKGAFPDTPCKMMRNASMANARGFLIMAENAAAS